ncbi:hypothetical protein [Microcoleus sp. Pol14C6]|uniref:hypothetical protein n=1 Tax=Microcoleus sp. Pol14C6 TaxID=3055399 RepID=UPI002FD78D18
MLAEEAVLHILIMIFKHREEYNKGDEVAATTKANISVNYRDTRVLDATELLRRGSATALINQALVEQSQIQQLSNHEEATK